MNFIKTLRVLQKHQEGAKNLSNKYGDLFVCARYKIDYQRRKKLKTVELIIDEKNWTPKNDDPYLNQIVKVRIAYGEIKMSSSVKRYGGVWNKEKKVWEVPLKAVFDLNIEDRLIK